MKILRWLRENVLFVITLFLLAFIPLYPKIPLFDVKHTWVYVRLEDIVIFVVLAIFAVFFFQKKITLKTPLTMPILLFWVVGALATIHGLLLIFPTLADVFPNVAFLSFLRRIEYMSLFFIAYASMREKKFLTVVIVTITVTLFLIVGYGIGQKAGYFPAFLTMNEEFAKGEPIYLSPLSRVVSTFAGHYDLAAYLVLVLPILASLLFGFRSWLVRVALLASIGLGLLLLSFTVSRISFIVALIALFLVILFQKKRFALFALPLTIFFSALLLMISTGLSERFGSTVKEIDVLVDAKTGEAIGNVKIAPKEYFADKIIKQKNVRDKDELDITMTNRQETPLASPSAVLLYERLPEKVLLLIDANASTGENLPQGTGYINLALSPVVRQTGEFYYEKPIENATVSAEILVIYGEFLIKRAAAYDLSFTTRYQGGWPKALAAFKRNILFGSGYGSVGLAVDNNYLRLLAETGILGLLSFIAIFLSLGIYIRKVLPSVDSSVVKSFVLGFSAGVIGLSLNALLIDVFEASKIAFTLWLLTGTTIGILHLYQKTPVDLYGALKKVVTSTYAITIGIFVLIILIYAPMLRNYFVGDDYTWFRWAADCTAKFEGMKTCPSFFTRVISYFTDAEGFFYRPGTKIYFLVMYTLFWLNQHVYHMVSLALHFLISLLLFFLAWKVLARKLLATVTVILYLITSSYHENTFWISATGHMFNELFMLLSLICFIRFDETKKKVFFVFTILFISASLLFHELGVVTPLLIFLYKYWKENVFKPLRMVKKPLYFLLFAPVFFYLLIRFLANSHWFSGNYSYSLLKLPFNVVGNIAGYIGLILIGPTFSPIYSLARVVSRDNIIFGILASVAVAGVCFVFYRRVLAKLGREERKVLVFAFFFFLITLLPFLGLGNITSRYSYLASFGVILSLIFFIQKLYDYLRSNGREVALATIVLLLSCFSLLHIMQTQQIHSDWYEAGEKARRFFISLDAIYGDYWSTEPMKFHFVNVPVRHNEAWVFPVGLEDALWLVFRNNDAHVFRWLDVKDALETVDGSIYERVLVFQDDGRVVEVKKTRPPS